MTEPVDFLIIGAMKAGTTSLFELLSRHPDVVPIRNKEPHYFTRNQRMPLSYYESIFSRGKPGQLRGEASPTYSWVDKYPEAPSRIASVAPSVRLVFVVREPVARMASHLRHQRLLGECPADADSALQDAALWQRSSYRRTVEAYLEHFSPESILVVDLDELRGGVDERTRAVMEHVGLDPSRASDFKLPRSNVSQERQAVHRSVGRLAQTPFGSLVRDLVPAGVVQLIKRVPQSFGSKSPAPTLPDVTVNDIRSQHPHKVAELDSQYEWVRNWNRSGVDGPVRSVT